MRILLLDSKGSIISDLLVGPMDAAPEVVQYQLRFFQLSHFNGNYVYLEVYGRVLA